ncbi:MAG: EAL domain-containing protein, partial [Halothiobacillus sp.]|nr:EAL domain-containing protein [Halothiobacillus sp.]
FLPLLGHAELEHLFRLGLEASLAELTQWDAAGLSVDIAVNLPPSNLLDADCPRWVAETLHRYGIAPGRLTLELLENQSIDMVQQDETIAAFLDMGVQLAMDDLGSGYSSLLRLSKIPFHTIKIDQGLLVHIRENPVQAVSLIASILQMGRDFDRVVVVEGLEDFGMIEAAALLGATYGQGYAIARPMPADEVTHWHPQAELAVNMTEIRTFLGALAYLWRMIHQRRTSPALPEENCPLTNFLSSCGRSDPEAAQWSGQVRFAVPGSDVSARLLAWLAEQVRNEVAETTG